jgi:hypothetical protein
MRLGQSEQCLERPAAVTQRSSACYRHWPFRCCSSPESQAEYQGARTVPVTSRDGWWPLDDDDEYDEMCRWPVLSDDFVRGPPAPEESGAAETA